MITSLETGPVPTIFVALFPVTRKSGMLPRMQKEFRLFISCALGIERALGNELRHLGIAILDSAPGRFDVAADTREILLCLRALRCAERVFVVLAEFKAHTFEDLFQGVKHIEWASWLPADSRIHIDKVRIRDSTLSAFASVQSVTQKAAYDRLCEQYHQRSMPETGVTHLVRVYLDKNHVRVCLDLAGEALHRRGYRTEAGAAPLKESVAAGLIILSGWKRRYPFHDPFCGSGTLPAEALFHALDCAPNLHRQSTFSQLKRYDAALDTELQAELTARMALRHEFLIRGTDRDPRMVELSRSNIARLIDGIGLDAETAQRIKKNVVIEQCRMEDLKHREDNGFFVCNPPWGERLGDIAEAQATYVAMRHLGTTFPDWSLVVMTSYPDLGMELDRKAVWKKPVRNGSIDSWFYLYQEVSNTHGQRTQH